MICCMPTVTTFTSGPIGLASLMMVWQTLPRRVFPRVLAVLQVYTLLSTLVTGVRSQGKLFCN